MNNDLSYDEGVECCFSAIFLVMEHVATTQILISNFFPDSPKPFQRNPSYFPDPGTDTGVCSVHNLSRLKNQPQPSYYCFQTQPIHELLHENLNQENASWDTLVISRIDFRHDHCKRKILGGVDGCQNIHHWSFWSHLTKSCCRAVPDNRFEVQNDPPCTEIGFSISALSREDRTWRKGTTKSSYVVTCQWISCDAEQAAAQSNHKCQWEDWFHAVTVEQEKGGVALHRQKPESIFKSGVWKYISCNLQSTNFVFHQIIYLREQRRIPPLCTISKIQKKMDKVDFKQTFVFKKMFEELKQTFLFNTIHLLLILFCQEFSDFINFYLVKVFRETWLYPG